MGKVKTVVMGDLEAEEKAREKERAKREAKKQTRAVQKSLEGETQAELQKTDTKREEKVAEKSATKHKEDINESPTEAEVVMAEAEEAVEIKAEKKSAKKKAVKTENKYTFQPGKKYVAAASLVDKSKTYSLTEAIELVKKTSYSKFDGTVEVHLNVSDKGLRGTVSLPHGTGREVRVKIADDKLITDLTASGKIDFDILVASPDMMPKLAKVAKILGPKGLMPNPKTNTISSEPEKLVKELSSGKIQWKTETNFPIIHSVLGKVSFDTKKLEENYLALAKSIGKDKIQSVFLKATMGPAIGLAL